MGNSQWNIRTRENSGGRTKLECSDSLWFRLGLGDISRRRGTVTRNIASWMSDGTWPAWPLCLVELLWLYMSIWFIVWWISNIKTVKSYVGLIEHFDPTCIVLLKLLGCKLTLFIFWVFQTDLQFVCGANLHSVLPAIIELIELLFNRNRAQLLELLIWKYSGWGY